MEWISTEWEEPAETGTMALIYPIDDDGMAVAEYVGEGWWVMDDYKIHGESFTHWMPLPSPPCEKGE